MQRPSPNFYPEALSNFVPTPIELQAIIYKSTGSWYTARAGNQFVGCRIRGKLKTDNEITSTNPVAVGDIVALEPGATGQEGLITGVLPRRNYMVRSSPHNFRQKHIIAANLDLAVLVTTLKDPRTSQGFMDRFLVTAEAYHIPALIVFNKSDLYTGSASEKLARLLEMYGQVGYPALVTSAARSEGLKELSEKLGGTSLLAGHSGTGKTTLINALMPGMVLKTRDVSGWSGKGMHTTTFAEMYDLPSGGKVIDTPGIRELGMVDLAPEEISQYFPDLKVFLPGCRFNNCLHVDEPGCAVKQAVEEGKIFPERYISYLGILESLV